MSFVWSPFLFLKKNSFFSFCESFSRRFFSFFQAILKLFLSDPSPIIGYACHSLTHWLTDWLTDWLTHSCLVDLMAVNDTNCLIMSQLLKAVIWELTFGPKAKLLFRLWAQVLVKILKSKFRQDFETGVCSAFCRCYFEEVLKLNLGQDFEIKFSGDADVWLRFLVDD